MRGVPVPDPVLRGRCPAWIRRCQGSLRDSSAFAGRAQPVRDPHREHADFGDAAEGSWQHGPAPPTGKGRGPGGGRRAGSPSPGAHSRAARASGCRSRWRRTRAARRDRARAWPQPPCPPDGLREHGGWLQEPWCQERARPGKAGVRGANAQSRSEGNSKFQRASFLGPVYPVPSSYRSQSMGYRCQAWPQGCKAPREVG